MNQPSFRTKVRNLLFGFYSVIETALQQDSGFQPAGPGMTRRLISSDTL